MIVACSFALGRQAADGGSWSVACQYTHQLDLCQEEACYPLAQAYRLCIASMREHNSSSAGSPAKEALEQQVFSPDNAVNRLVGCITYGADWVSLGGLLWLTLKAFRLASQMDCDLDVRQVCGCCTQQLKVTLDAVPAS